MFLTKILNRISCYHRTGNSVATNEKPEEPKIGTPVYNNMVFLLDNGHASSTPGKYSPKFPDGTRFYEYAFNREIVEMIADGLDELGIRYHILVPEIVNDISLTTRATRANAYATKYGKNNCLLISVHANAFGNGETWNSARGWSVYTTKGITKSDEYATIFFEEAEKILSEYGMTLRKDMSDGDPDYEENFTILYKSICPAILTENLFFTNKTDVGFLLSDEGKRAIADIHINAIKRVCLK